MTERIRPTWAGEVERLHELLVAQATRSGEPYVTVEHTLNAKGDTQTSTKVSAPFGFDLNDLDDYAHHVEKIAANIYAAATSRYPRSQS
jgi:UDP-N-acetylmuramate-alanine ligase